MFRVRTGTARSISKRGRVLVTTLQPISHAVAVRRVISGPERIINPGNRLNRGGIPTFAAVEKSNFVDQIRIFCRTGHGGAGSKHFAHTKFNDMAGPDGGNGGRMHAPEPERLAA